MKPYFRNIILFFTLFLFTGNCYLLHLAGEQISLFAGRKKISDVTSSKRTDAGTRRKLELVEELGRFAVNDLSLDKEGRYIYYVKLYRPAVGWNVSASGRLAFKPHTWWFPIAGTVPYKGFFDKQLAEKEEQELKEKGLDTKIRTIGGYSTLGWISVPVMSPQLEAAEDNLAGLVFHEMAHATIYFPDDSLFNESYASFMEEEGVKLYYTRKEGANSPTLKKREIRKKKKRLLLGYARKTAKKLENLYASTLGDEQKLKKKQEIILRFKKELISDPFLKKHINKKELMKKEINNEDFSGLFRYHSGYDYFYKILKNTGFNFAEFHREMEKLKKLSPEKRKKLLL